MTATATAPRRTVESRVAPRPTPRRGDAVARQRPAALRPELRVVTPAPRRYPARAVISAAVLLVFGSLLVSAMFHSMLVSGQGRLDDLDRQIAQERKQLEQDRLTLAEMSSPERIAAEAERLGLVFAERQTWISPGKGNTPVVTGETEADTDTDTDGSGTAGTGGTGQDVDDQNAEADGSELAVGATSRSSGATDRGSAGGGTRR